MRFGSILIVTGTLLLGIGGTPAHAQETAAPSPDSDQRPA